jgi:hypothetical protein
VQPDDASPLLARGAGPVVEMVTGSGHFVPNVGVNAGLWRTFSMTARKYADGSVSGTYNRVAHLEEGGVAKGHGTVMCFTIVGNKTWIGGMDPDANPPDVAWQVVDNGEGVGADPDQAGLQIGAADFGFPAGFAQDFCDEQPEELDFGPPFGVTPLWVILFDVEGGNIQIKN